MPAAFARLRAAVEASFAPVPAGEAPEAALARVDAEIAACFAALLEAGAPAPFHELTALADDLRDRSRALPREVARAHHDWLRIVNGWYKLVVGADGRPRAPSLPAGAPSLPLALVPRVYERIRELRYALHRREHPSACDCAALVAGGLSREPASPELRRDGPSTDGYHSGDAFVCGACGAKWFRGVSADDHGGWFWEPARDE